MAKRRREKSEVRRYNVGMTPELYERLTEMAVSRHVTLAEVIRSCFKVALYVMEQESQPGSSLVLRRYNEPDTLVKLLY